MTAVSPQMHDNPTPGCEHCARAARRRANRIRRREQARDQRRLRLGQWTHGLRHSCHPGSPARIKAKRVAFWTIQTIVAAVILSAVGMIIH